ncbi:HupE/UreJ family protein [Kaustia mangrovi]|uniref:HupE/UreJ family protein n=1 Tax=Kaustia mangrovi TaxID=2593653 RepID=A0A7S8C6L0_9HYPH|nr:HupE/UreJ family protein [Kaustia mangrovi]QPC44164.1 HupE/UreJ family protein [Kaustia mangrovi]
MRSFIRIAAPAALFALVTVEPASAHVGAGSTSSFAAGLTHPLGGLDHILAMVAVGLWAALKGGRALWVWPCAFVGVMLVGGALGMAGMPLAFVEPGILASIVALGILVALAVDLPVAAGAVLIGVFALFHGHAHGMEAPAAGTALLYAAGFALATAGLHGVGVLFGLVSRDALWRNVIRGAGAATAAAGLALAVV